MDRNSVLIGALAGAAVGAIVGSFVTSEKGRQLVDSASQGLKDVTNRVSEYAKENIPGLNRERQTERSSYTESSASDMI
jgi:gas vesicle protein